MVQWVWEGPRSRFLVLEKAFSCLVNRLIINNAKFLSGFAFFMPE